MEKSNCQIKFLHYTHMAYTDTYISLMQYTQVDVNGEVVRWYSQSPPLILAAFRLLTNIVTHQSFRIIMS